MAVEDPFGQTNFVARVLLDDMAVLELPEVREAIGLAEGILSFLGTRATDPDFVTGVIACSPHSTTCYWLENATTGRPGRGPTRTPLGERPAEETQEHGLCQHCRCGGYCRN